MLSYRGKLAWLSTKHEKLNLIAPAMLETAGLEVREIEVNTDQLGTFSGEIQRTLSPLETAIAKAKLGLSETGGTLGLASEGSIGPDSQNPFLVSDIEIVVFIDLANDLAIHEVHRSFDIVAKSKSVKPGDDLSDFLESIDFPNQGLIARVPNTDLEISKGLNNQDQLITAIENLYELSAGKEVYLETDFRAHQSPTRRKNIEVAAKKLAQRIASICPGCKTAGFGLVRYENGLNCEACGIRNESAIANELLCCVGCDYTQAGAVIAKSLPAERCDWCNP